MIFIDRQEVIAMLPDGWKAEAKTVTDALRAASGSTERKKIIDENDELWRRIKNVLAEVGHNKCWYCETGNIRSDNAVDHFRPKGKVSGTQHGGYWWLAFDVKNYRFACTFCNSRRHGDGGTTGGKADHFPLMPGSRRADSPLIPISVEIPMLLDPCDYFDTTAIWFDETGQVKVNPEAEVIEENVPDRVSISRDLYHLDHVRLIEARKRVFLDVLEMCDQADDALLVYKSTRDAAARTVFRDSINSLKRMRREDAPYSAVAKCAVRGYRSSSPSAKIIAEVP
ncbi:HNH endonuclease signature motif containing protein [Streptomyces europaeiscabiei]|uniref:HNH endonuclease signature motif containing protein n=1 Tax=Streptomyces europaeiscabiei TaxID=146819 RepID=A0ABU4NJR3_9ACTN|nr:HNH endonuclease signature motif containing protein [Streptomyces europaeiscabiei]MDX3544871.1 HNH endonuclease signature motif containing protein [Streptomyces europaeiscabiei]MDX3554559.1 HNH endonuclease signature motif containing protein [Streptomyces europaeiscabiei]MDX3702539.1 HNH endonuclease signature motif containing protein [Streptomyces europaeiscabiei]